MTELEDLNFEHARVLAFYEIKTEFSTNFVMIAQGQKLRSQIIVFDKELRIIAMNEFQGYQISQVADSFCDGRYLFALNEKQNLMAIHVNLLCHGITPCQIIEFKQHCNKFLMIDQENISLLHASGEILKVQKHLFNGEVKLEEPRGENNYLAWSQKGNIFAAVDRFNIVTFWNSLTGKIIYRKVLEGPARIQDASSYRCHDCQTRYQDSSNLFDSITQTIVSYRMHLKLADESRDQYRMKIVKLNLFEES